MRDYTCIIVYNSSLPGQAGRGPKETSRGARGCRLRGPFPGLCYFFSFVRACWRACGAAGVHTFRRIRRPADPDPGTGKIVLVIFIYIIYMYFSQTQIPQITSGRIDDNRSEAIE